MDCLRSLEILAFGGGPDEIIDAFLLWKLIHYFIRPIVVNDLLGDKHYSMRLSFLISSLLP